MNAKLKTLAIGIMAALPIALAPATAVSSPAFSFFGTWRIDALVGYSEISANPDDLKKLVGRHVVITRERLKIGDDDCRISALQKSTRDTTQLLLERYKAGPTDAGIPLRTEILETESCGDVFRAGNDIVVSEGGAFFRASRVTGRHAVSRKP